MRFFDNEYALTQAVNGFPADRALQIGLVSTNVPLISNQDVCMNISLIKEYHENLSKREARQIALEGLRRLGLEHAAFKRNPSLSPEERFCVMLLRAAMIRDAIILIDRPFRMIPHLKDIQYVGSVLKKIDDFYRSCNIYDYVWMKDKYGDL